MFFFSEEEISRSTSNSSNINSSYTETIFESIKHINEYEQEFGYARELQTVLKYTK